MKILFILSVGLGIVMSIPSFAESSDVGTSGGIILSQAIGAKAAGLAEAYTAGSGDVGCLYYNPAGLAFLNKKQASFAYQTGIAEDKFGLIDFGTPIKKGVFAGSIVYYTAGDIELINVSGNTWTVNALKEYLIIMSYSRKLIRNISFGMNVKILESEIVEAANGTAYAIDFGGLYKRERLSLGIAIQNIGTKLKYLRVSDPLPRNIRMGISYSFNKWTIAMDAIKPNDGKRRESLGVEYLYSNLLSLRTGYKFGHDLDSLYFGIGFNIGGITLDYGISAMNELSYNHKISLTYHF